MKKRIIPALLAMLMVLSLVGCGKTTATVVFKEAESVSIVNLESVKGSSGSTHDNVLELTATKDVENVIVLNVDEEEVKVTYTFKGKDCTLVTEPQTPYTMVIK